MNKILYGAFCGSTIFYSANCSAEPLTGDLVKYVADLALLLDSNSEISAGVIAAIVFAIISFVFRLPVREFQRFVAWRRKRKVSRYTSSTSLDDREIVESLQSYIRPECMDVDPANKLELRDALALERRDLIKEVDNFLKRRNPKHLFVFADCGMGKTSFLINYFYRRKTGSPFKKSPDIALVYLSKSNSLDEIERIPYDKRKETVLLLDALDEDPFIFGDVKKRIEKILSSSEDFMAIIITCRSQFFSNEEVIPTTSGAVRTGPTGASVSKDCEIARIYIAPFDDARINRYLKRALPGVFNRNRRKKARDIVDKVPSLTVRPMLLAHISDVMSEDEEVFSPVQIYQAMVSAWVKREDHWVKAKPLIEFSRRLALDLYEQRDVRGGEFCSPNDLSELAERFGVEIKNEHLTARSLLNRTSDGKFKFAHRSILEYFVAESILLAPGGYSLDVTDQMASFLLQKLGLPDSRIGHALADTRIKLSVLAPVVRAGYATNYNLYKKSAVRVDPNRIFCLEVRSERAPIDEVWTVGDCLHEAISFAGVRGKVTDIRINVSKRSKFHRFASCYLSVWFEGAAVLSKLSIDIHALESALELRRGDTDEVVVQGIIGAPGGLEAIAWTLLTRCDIWRGNDFGAGDLIDSPGVSILHDESERALAVQLVAGSDVAGPLYKFGILKGGSAQALERQKFVLLPQASVAHSEIGKEIESIKPKVAPAELWPSDRRA